MKRICNVLISLAIFLPLPAAAASLDLNLSDDAVRLKYRVSARNSGLETNASLLHTQDRGDVGAVGLHLVDDADPGSNTLEIGLGMQGVFMDTDLADGGALAVGGRFRWTLPNFNRFGVGGQLYYAPDVTSFGDTERYREGAIRFEYQILRQADVYIGYRSVKADFFSPGISRTIDSGIHAGFRLTF